MYRNKIRKNIRLASVAARFQSLRQNGKERTSNKSTPSRLPKLHKQNKHRNVPGMETKSEVDLCANRLICVIVLTVYISIRFLP